jgi:GT2 family glycosyltransferase
MNINIQILTYNSSKDLGLFLRSLPSVKLGDNSLFLHFVDQSENKKELNRTREIIEEGKKKLPEEITIELLEQPNYGFGKGHNEIYKRDKTKYGDFFVILNPDSFLMYDTILQMVQYLNSVKDLNWGLLEMEQFPNEHPKYYDPKTLETPWASGAGLVINTKAFESVGLFDENIFMYGEDVDLSASMRKNNYKVLHMPACEFVHLTTDTDISEPSDFVFNHKQAAELYIRYKHGKESDVEHFDEILKANSRNYDEIKKMYSSMISEKPDRKLLRDFIAEDQDYTKFRWTL